MQIPAEILKKVKLIELQTRKLVNNVFMGEYHTAFKGQGMTFADFREYIHGDDIRHISWSLTARSNKTHIKRFDEERELSLILAVDVSGSGDFGSGPYCKGEILVHLAALIGFSAVKNQDQVGLLLFSDQIEHYVPPKKGNAQMHRILRDLLFFKPKNNKTKISVACEHLNQLLKKKAHIFLLSDFQDQGFEKALKSLARKHDLVCVKVEDKMEKNLPDIGLLELQDAETGEFFILDSSSKEVQKIFAAQQDEAEKKLKKQFLQNDIDAVFIPATENYVEVLIQFFRSRHKK